VLLTLTLALAASADLPAGGLRVSYRGGDWAVSARFPLRSGWCAPAFRWSPAYAPVYWGHSPWISYYGYTDGGRYVPDGPYYGVRYLASDRVATPEPAPVAAARVRENASLTPEAELDRVLAEMKAERIPAEAPLDPRIEVPEALAELAQLPAVNGRPALTRVR
jgi:hypothetical protein